MWLRKPFPERLCRTHVCLFVGLGVLDHQAGCPGVLQLAQQGAGSRARMKVGNPSRGGKKLKSKLQGERWKKKGKGEGPEPRSKALSGQFTAVVLLQRTNRIT